MIKQFFRILMTVILMPSYLIYATDEVVEEEINVVEELEIVEEDEELVEEDEELVEEDEDLDSEAEVEEELEAPDVEGESLLESLSAAEIPKDKAAFFPTVYFLLI